LEVRGQGDGSSVPPRHVTQPTGARRRTGREILLLLHHRRGRSDAPPAAQGRGEHPDARRASRRGLWKEVGLISGAKGIISVGDDFRRWPRKYWGSRDHARDRRVKALANGISPKTDWDQPLLSADAHDRLDDGRVTRGATAQAGCECRAREGWRSATVVVTSLGLWCARNSHQ
jgi:hypothetical protein